MLFQSIPVKTKPSNSILGELYFIFEYFSFLENIFQRRRIEGKNVWFAEERITDKEKKENIWV